MKSYKPLSLLFIILLTISRLSAQDPQIFTMVKYPTDSTHFISFISLSDVYPLSENPDSAALPDLSQLDESNAKAYTKIKLDSLYRKRFLNGVHLTENDRVFIYDYSSDALLSYQVKKLNVIAVLNVYGGEWPYQQGDYMIGFEIDKEIPPSFRDEYAYTIVVTGNKSPLERGLLHKIKWQIVLKSKFPVKTPPVLEAEFAGKCNPGEVYRFAKEGLEYFLQEYISTEDGKVAVKRLIIRDDTNKNIILEKLYYRGESAYFSDLNEQWTGRLFKDKPPVIFGFQYFSFGCGMITFIDSPAKDVSINCDNRH